MISKNWLDLSYSAGVFIKGKSIMATENGGAFDGLSWRNRIIRKMIMKKRAFQSLVLTVILVMVSSISLFAQATYTSTGATGNWGATSTWVIGGTPDSDGNGLPDANDNVIIANGTTVQINLSAFCKDMTINGNGIVRFTTNFAASVAGNLIMDGTSQIISDADNAARTFTVTGTFNVPASATNARIGNASFNPTVTINGATTIAGTLSLLTDARVKTFNAVSVTGSFNSTAVTTTTNLVFKNGISSSGTVTVGGATFNTTSGQTVGGSGNMSFANNVSVAINTTLTGSGAILFGVNSAVTVAAAVTLTNNNTSTVTMSNTTGGLLSGGALSGFTQGPSSTLLYAGSAMSVAVLTASALDNIVNYTGASPTIKTPATTYYDLTFSGSGTASIATLRIIGDLTVSSGIFNCTSSVSFEGIINQSISGSGTINLASISMALTGANVLVNTTTDIAVSSSIFFTNDCLMVVGANSNIVLGSAATIGTSTTFDNRYIQLDESTSSNGQLIKTTDGSLTGASSWRILYPIGTATGGYTPLDLSTATITTAPAGNSLLKVKPIYGASVTGQMRRQFRLTVTGNANSTTFASGKFSYTTATDLSAGDVVGNYTNRWYLSFANGTWFNNLAGTAPGSNVGTLYTYTVTTAEPLSNGTYYFALGNSTAFTNIWYSYQNGVWNDPDIWTLDPSGTTLNNPLNQVPLSGDQVVILSNITVTCNVSSLTLSSVTIQSNATLDMGTTTGHNFGTVSGTGLLRIAGTASAVNLPSGTYTSFVASTGGTIEYYASSAGTYTVSATQSTYNNLLLSNGSNTAITFVTAPSGTVNSVANSLLINGTMNVTQTAGSGTVTWQINDGTATSRNITITGDLTVSANGRINAGTGAATTTITYNIAPTTATVGKPHSLKLLGDFTNNGKVQFFDITDAVFASSLTANSAPATSVSTATTKGNAVNVTFSGTTDQTITCNSQTDFYRFIVDKGTTQQALAIVISTAAYNMRLFAPSNMGSSGSDTFNDGPTTKSNNALAIYNGTLKLQGPITIPLLNVSGLVTSSTGCMIATGDNRCNTYFAIPQTAGLWLNDKDVNITVCDNAATNDNHRLLVGGLLKITDGTLSCGRSKGLNSGAAGTVIIEGGTLNAWQIRPTTTSTNNFSYSQSGGKVNVGMETAFVGVTSDSYARFSIPSNTSSFQMTGGEINIRTPTANSITGIDVSSDVANYNVTKGIINAYIQSGSANDFSINSTAPLYQLVLRLEGGTKIFKLNRALTVLDSLVLVSANSPKLYCQSNNLTIGGDFDVQSGTTFHLGTASPAATGSNTITFNGSGSQTWTHNGTINSLSDVVMNKSAGTLTLAGANTFPNITGTTFGLALTSGTLADGGKVLSITGAGLLSNNATVTGTGSIYYNSTASTIAGSGGTFSSLTLFTSAGVTINLGGSQTVTNILRLQSSTILNIGSYSLTVLGNMYTGAGTATAFSASQKIQTAGNRNDGGLTLKGTSGNDLIFPVGTSTALYTPITMNVTATTMGTIKVKPVASRHPNALNTNNVAFYWSVTSSGFPASVTAVHKAYTYASAAKGGTLTSYVAARYDPINFKWGYSNATYDATSATTINIGSFNTAGTGGGAWTNVVPAGSFIDGEYTSGQSGSFGVVKVYYCALANNGSGNWGDPATWSTVAVGNSTSDGTTPCSTCPVVIGNSSFSQTVNISADAQGCGSLYLDQNSVLNCASFLTLNFGINTSGTGKLRVSRNVMPGGDFLNLIGSSGGTIEWYGGPYTIPTNSLNTYYKLIVNSSTGTLTMPASDLTIYNTFTKNGSGIAVTDPGRTYTLKNDFNVTAGTFNINTASGTTTITQTGNTNISSGATLGVSSVTGTHTFSTTGNITNDGTLNCSTVLNLTFTGSSNNSITGTTVGASTTLNKITVNKGTDQTYILTLDALGTLSVPSNNWLTITNGTFNFNKTGSTITLTNTATNPYTILSTSKLKVSGGTVEISKITADDSDLILNGTLEVAGGTVYVGNFSTKPLNNNDIEYASTGSPTINVSSGTLYVNGAIRRPTAILAGALVYNQTGGAVTIGGQNALNARAVFDIENNTGSVFNLKNAGTLTISKPITTTPSFSDLYLNPSTSLVDATSIIYIGAAGATQTITVNTDPDLGSFYVYDNTTVSMQNTTLRASGTVTINPSGVLNTNSLDVTIGGNLTINGSGIYNGTIGSGNTTTFNGTGAQAGTLSSGSTFLNLTVNKSSGTVSLSGTSPTITNLNILNGTLDVGTLDITVTGDIINNSIETGTTGKILLGGTATTQNITSSNGVFQNLTLTGSAGSKTVTVTGNMVINGTLNFATTNRYLNIGSYQLKFGTTGAVTGAVATAFIKTNGVSSDLGVVKSWLAGSATAFTYAVGTRTNYTPIVMTLTVTSPGDMTVIPVDDRHPTANTASSEQILNYYWIITRGSSIAYSTTGSHIYAFPSALMGGTGGTLTAGYLDVNSSSPGWITNDATSSATTTSMSFNGGNLATNLPLISPNNEFHYSVGTVNTLPNPIIPIYSRLADASVSSAGGGSWNSANSWTTQSDGLGSAWGAIPFGNYIVILPGATVNADASGRKAFITEIQGNGVLALTNGKVGHSLGIIRGTGTLKTTLSTLPAGNYTPFVSATGGTIEYSGPVGGTLAMNNARTVYNNIAISATTTGAATTVTVPALDLTLNGGVTIKSGATFSNSANRNISIGTNWTNSGGTFVPGTGMLTFNGSLASTITGATPFNNVTINKSGNDVTLAGTGPTTINNTLTLTSGNIISITANKLTLPVAATISGGSSSSFIAGPMSKVMVSGSTFSYPIGAITASRYRPAILGNTTASDTWTVEYVGNDPSNQGYSHLTHASPINKVSMFEYWNISRLGSTAADVTLTYNSGSYLGSDIGNVANLRVVHWNTATSSWEVAPGGGTVSQSGTNITGTVTTTNQTSFSPDTFGSLDIDSPLPVTWLAFTGNRVDNSVVLEWATAQERNNDHFEIQRSVDGKTFDKIGSQLAVGNSSTVQRYKFTDREVLKSATYYYRIKQVDVDGQSDFSKVVVITGDGKSLQRWAALPNPTSDNTHFHIQIMDESVDTAKPIQIQIISSNGVIVYEGEGQTDQLNKKLDGIMQSFGQGIYIVQISDGTYRENFRIAKM